MTSLKGLDVSYTQITDVGCVALTSSLNSGGLPALWSLNLADIPAHPEVIAAVYAVRTGMTE